MFYSYCNNSAGRCKMHKIDSTGNFPDYTHTHTHNTHTCTNIILFILKTNNVKTQLVFVYFDIGLFIYRFAIFKNTYKKKTLLILKWIFKI